jgi:hypothetical protein
MRPAEDADLAILLEHVLDSAIELEGADFGAIQLYDGETGTLRIGGSARSFWGTSPASTRSIRRRPAPR